MAAGVTQPSGAGTTIYVYDDASSASGTGYTWAEISAAFPTDFVSNGTFLPSYRAKVSVQIGDTTTNSATTSIVDATDSTVIFDSGKTLSWRTTQPASWFLTLGTKIGTGDKASGVKGGCVVAGTNTVLRGTVKMYGIKWVQNTGSLAGGTVVDGSSELVNCILQSNPTSGTAVINLGSATVSYDNIYNVDVTNSSTAAQTMQFLQGNSVERCTISCAAANPALLINNTPDATYKDLALFGTPTTSVIRYTQAAATNQEFVRPQYPDGYAKFSFVNTSTDPDDGTHERWYYNAKVVDGSGAAVEGIPITLTDSDGNIQMDTTTNSAGETTFGSGVTADTIIVMDHYGEDAGGSNRTYTQRHRSPFLLECNMPYQTGYNNNYFSHRYYFNWPGYAVVTTTSGTFSDVADIIQLGAVASGGSTWVERVVP